MKGKTALIWTLVLALAGCGAEKKADIENVAKRYNPTIENRINRLEVVELSPQLEGRIVKVQPSSISYSGAWDGRIYGSNISANHEFEYVMVEGKDGKVHTFIYPYSKAILERNATVRFKSLEGGAIDSETFIDRFLKKEYFTDDNVLLEAEGVIIPGGINYN
jgi:hypothetical protein